MLLTVLLILAVFVLASIVLICLADTIRLFDDALDCTLDPARARRLFDRVGLVRVVPDSRRSGDLMEINMHPLTCVCGSQTFSQIHCIEPGILALRCFACSLLMNVSVSAMAAEAAWERMEAEAPEPTTPTIPTTPKRSGSKYGGLL